MLMSHYWLDTRYSELTGFPLMFHFSSRIPLGTLRDTQASRLLGVLLVVVVFQNFLVLDDLDSFEKDLSDIYRLILSLGT